MIHFIRSASVSLLILILFFPAVSLAGGELQEVYVFFDVPGEEIAAPITVVLSNLQPIEFLPASAQASVIAEENRRIERTHLGIRSLPGLIEGGREWMNSPLITRKKALIQVRRIAETRELVQAGYMPPSESSTHRTPWIMITAAGDSRWADGIFEIQSRSEAAQSVTLLEVVAIEETQIYFTGITSNSEEILLSAAYSYSFAPDKFRPPAVTARAAGTP